MENVKRLTTIVRQQDLDFGNAPMNMWTRVKDDPGFVPHFMLLKNAPLWQDAQRFRSTVWSWLTDGEVYVPPSSDGQSGVHGPDDRCVGQRDTQSLLAADTTTHTASLGMELGHRFDRVWTGLAMATNLGGGDGALPEGDC